LAESKGIFKQQKRVVGIMIDHVSGQHAKIVVPNKRNCCYQPVSSDKQQSLDKF
jgi:hypothetical protein